MYIPVCVHTLYLNTQYLYFSSFVHIHMYVRMYKCTLYPHTLHMYVHMYYCTVGNYVTCIPPPLMSEEYSVIYVSTTTLQQVVLVVVCCEHVLRLTST